MIKMTDNKRRERESIYSP